MRTCARCKSKSYYEFDGIQFCQSHGETYLVERAYGNAQKEVESFLWRVAREKQWWNELPELSELSDRDDRDLTQILDDFARMPPKARMRALFGGRPIPPVEYEEISPMAYVNSEAFQKGLKAAQEAIDSYGKLMANFKFPDLNIKPGDQVTAPLKGWSIHYD